MTSNTAFEFHSDKWNKEEISTQSTDEGPAYTTLFRNK